MSFCVKNLFFQALNLKVFHFSDIITLDLNLLFGIYFLTNSFFQLLFWKNVDQTHNTVMQYSFCLRPLPNVQPLVRLNQLLTFQSKTFFHLHLEMISDRNSSFPYQYWTDSTPSDSPINGNLYKSHLSCDNYFPSYATQFSCPFCNSYQKKNIIIYIPNTILEKHKNKISQNCIILLILSRKQESRLQKLAHYLSEKSHNYLQNR